MALRRLWTPRGSLTAVAVVGALVVVITSCGDSRDAPGQGSQQATPGTATPGTATPGPKAPFVGQVTTAFGVDPSGAPVHPASRFQVGAPVYVICSVWGVAQGQAHRLTVRWFLNNALAQVSGAYVSTLVTQDGPVSFHLSYPRPGAGMAQLSWDEPVGDNNDAPNDRFLAQTITFTIQSA